MNSITKETGKGTKEDTISLAAQKIDNGVVELELAYDLLQIISDAAESEFTPIHPENVSETLIINRLSMYSSAITIFENAMKNALTELQDGRNSLYNGIRKGGVAV